MLRRPHLGRTSLDICLVVFETKVLGKNEADALFSVSFPLCLTVFEGLEQKWVRCVYIS